MLNRRMFFGVLASAAAAATLAACGKGGSSGSGSAVGPDGKVTIEYWHVNADTQGGAAVTSLVDEFNGSQSEVVVKPVYNAGMYQGLMQKLQSAAAAGNSPALVQVGWSYREYFSNNYSFVEPAEVIKSFPEDSDFLSSKFLDNVLALAKNNDQKQVGLPYSLSVPILYGNQGILEQAGVDMATLTDWESVREGAKKIAATGKKGLYIAEAADIWNMQQMIESNGGKIITDGKASFASPEGIATMQFYQDMIKEGSALHAPNAQGQQAFVAGDIGLGHMTIGQRTNVTKNGKFTALGMAAPAFKGKEVNVPAGGSLMAITAEDADSQKAAWKFLKFLYEPESVKVWTDGTGYLPETKDATENAELNTLLTSDPLFKAASATLPRLQPWAPWPGDTGLQIEQQMIDMRDKILGGADVASTMQQTQEQINATLN